MANERGPGAEWAGRGGAGRARGSEPGRPPGPPRRLSAGAEVREGRRGCRAGAERPPPTLSRRLRGPGQPGSAVVWSPPRCAESARGAPPCVLLFRAGRRHHVPLSPHELGPGGPRRPCPCTGWARAGSGPLPHGLLRGFPSGVGEGAAGGGGDRLPPVRVGAMRSHVRPDPCVGPGAGHMDAGVWPVCVTDGCTAGEGGLSRGERGAPGWFLRCSGGTWGLGTGAGRGCLGAAHSACPRGAQRRWAWLPLPLHFLQRSQGENSLCARPLWGSPPSVYTVLGGIASISASRRTPKSFFDSGGLQTA